jgi:hypothetical protein
MITVSMTLQWHEAKHSFMELARLHVQWTEREMVSLSDESEKYALEEARVDLLQAIFAVLSMSEQQPPT